MQGEAVPEGGFLTASLGFCCLHPPKIHLPCSLSHGHQVHQKKTLKQYLARVTFVVI